MKEEEARKKWCPMVAKEAESDLCIASDCMMWRWRERYSTENPNLQLKSNSGYCGLGGK